MTAFADVDLKNMLAKGKLSITGVKNKNIQPSSIDLSLQKGEYYITNRYFNITNNKLARYASKRGYVEDKPVLEVGKTYLLPGPEIRVPRFGYGSIEQKSTAGRLGIHSELIPLSSRVKKINRLDEGISTKTWFRIEPRAFPIQLEPGDCLNQIRVSEKNTGFLGYKDLKIMYGNEISMRDKNLKLINEKEALEGDSTVLNFDITSGLLQKNTNKPIVYGKKQKHDITDYFDVIVNKKPSLEIAKGKLYLLSSEQVTDTGKNVCWKLRMKTEELGMHVETHRAGFGDPNFKASVTAEILNHHKNIIIDKGQYLSRLLWEETSKTPEKVYEGHYQKQTGPTPPKQFKGYRDIWKKVKEGEIETRKV